MRFADRYRMSIALIAGLLFSCTAAGANLLCEGKNFGAVTHDLLTTKETAKLPKQVRALHRGIWISNTGLFINEGIAMHIEVDLNSGVARDRSRVQKGRQIPNGYEALEEKGSLNQEWQLIGKTVRLTPQQIGDITCLANTVWSHRPFWEVEFELRSAEGLRAWRKWEQQVKRLTSDLAKCKHISHKLERDRCLDAVPAPPAAPPSLEIVVPPIFDPDLFAEATDVESMIVLRNGSKSREISGLGVFSGKAELLAKAIYILFR